MTDAKAQEGKPAWAQAALAACILAVEPQALGGIVVTGGHGDCAQAWLEALVARLTPGSPVRRIPLNVDDSRLIGGLDLTATLQAGRPMLQRGLLAEADQGLVVLSMAECRSAAHLARFTPALDFGEVRIERDHKGSVACARIAIVAMLGGDPGVEGLLPVLSDRLGLRIDLTTVRSCDVAPFPYEREEIIAARHRAVRLSLGSDLIEALATVAASFGIESLRTLLFAVRAARIFAALEEAEEVSEEHVRIASELVLLSNACDARGRGQPMTTSPSEAKPQSKTPEESGPPPPQPFAAEPPESHEKSSAGPNGEPEAAESTGERLVAAARAKLPPGLLASMQASPAGHRALGGGRSSTHKVPGQRGRPLGARTGTPRGGARLDLVETLRAAAPWQGLRAREDSHTIPGLVRIRASDLKVRERAQCPALAILFVVDASGSSAAHRLGEAKGAVQLLLADCYVRRDRVGLISFRGRSADILLEPTRSLTRAKRSLAALPGGGATPLATAIDTVVVEVERITKRGQTPIVVFLTDARANVARDGTQGRERAANDVNQAATALRARRTPTLLVDTGVRASPAAESLARTLGARYLALPEVGALDLSQAVRHAAHRSAPGRPA